MISPVNSSGQRRKEWHQSRTGRKEKAFFKFVILHQLGCRFLGWAIDDAFLDLMVVWYKKLVFSRLMMNVNNITVSAIITSQMSIS